MYGLVGVGYRCGGMVGLADGMAAGSWYSVLRDLSSNFCSTLCAFEADLMSMNDTVAHTPLAPSTTSSFDLASILTLCTRPYLWQKTRVDIISHVRNERQTSGRRRDNTCIFVLYHLYRKSTKEMLFSFHL